MADRLDIVVFGATGFTGGLLATYLSHAAPLAVRLGIAGRNRAKLEEARARTGGRAEIIEASVDDPASLARMAARARVIATTVGPYARYGEPVVRAAIENGAHCLDITGEPAYVADILTKHHQRAKDAALKIVSCCGFDSIPHDLGVLYTVKQLDDTRPITIEGIVQAKGGMSGGTWHSAVNAFADVRASRAANDALVYRDERGERPDRIGATKLRVRREPRVKGWIAPMPTIDPAIVLRSAGIIGYGPRFRYGHYLRAGSVLDLAALGVGVGGVVALSQLGPTRELLLKWKSPGEGQDEEARAKNFFRVTFLAEQEGRHLTTRVSGGDPGYTETAKMLGEAALSIVLDGDRLPNRFGVLTPAAAFGMPLVGRLDAAGLRFETL
ncbi:MAG: saccharopine dehydrogenase NADP-binding domain-containing protein [Polyangiaceae bacterium]